jgi:hypothetical protein
MRVLYTKIGIKLLLDGCKIDLRLMVPEIAIYTEPLIGQPCCRRRVGRASKSLSLGFGRVIPHTNPKLPDAFYGEWEIGSYYAAWRIVREGRILCGSQDAVDSPDELQASLEKIQLGSFISVSESRDFDVRVNLDGAVCVDFLGTISDDDETFHIFGPSALFIGFSPLTRWRVGNSDRPRQ